MAEASSEKKDAWQNKITGRGTSCDKVMQAVPVSQEVSNKYLEALFESDDVAERIVSKLPQAAMNKGFDLIPKKDEPFYEYFWTLFRELELDTKFLEAWELGRLYGNAVLIIDAEDGLDRNLPLNMKSISTVRWACVLEKEYYEVIQTGSSPASPYYRKPEIIRITPHSAAGGGTIPEMLEFHASRCIFFDGKKLPWTSYEKNNYSHASVLKNCYEHLQRFDSVYSAVAQLMPEMRQIIYKMPDFAQLIGAGEEKAIQGRLVALQLYRSLYRMTVMDAEETIETNEASFAGVEQIMDKFSRRIVQASGMPHTIVLGEGSTGNTSGRTESEEWAATVAEAQQAYLTPKIKRVIELFAAIKGAPALPENGFEVTYASILAKPDSEKAAEYKTVAEADDIYLRNGVLLPEEVRSRWSDDGFKFEIELSEDYDAQETDEQLLNKMGVQASGDDQANSEGRGNLAEGN